MRMPTVENMRVGTVLVDEEDAFKIYTISKIGEVTGGLMRCRAVKRGETKCRQLTVSVAGNSMWRVIESCDT